MFKNTQENISEEKERARNNLIFGITYKEFTVYGLQALGIFMLTFIILFAFGLTPKAFKLNNYSNIRSENVQTTVQTESEVPTTIQRRVNIGNANNNNTVNSQSQTQTQTQTTPTRVIINKIGVDSIVQRPISPNVDVLDEALTKGAVYYPGSGSIESGNIFLFGHSTGFQIVQNQAYKTFNDLDKLVAGDAITLFGTDGEVYTYSVQKVALVDADEAFVDFNKTGKRLTISTCNSFGAKQERWVVEAVLI